MKSSNVSITKELKECIIDKNYPCIKHDLIQFYEQIDDFSSDSDEEEEENVEEEEEDIEEEEEEDVEEKEKEEDVEEKEEEENNKKYVGDWDNFINEIRKSQQLLRKNRIDSLKKKMETDINDFINNATYSIYNNSISSTYAKFIKNIESIENMLFKMKIEKSEFFDELIIDLCKKVWSTNKNDVVYTFYRKYLSINKLMIPFIIKELKNSTVFNELECFLFSNLVDNNYLDDLQITKSALSSILIWSDIKMYWYSINDKKIYSRYHKKDPAKLKFDQSWSIHNFINYDIDKDIQKLVIIASTPIKYLRVLDKEGILPYDLIEKLGPFAVSQLKYYLINAKDDFMCQHLLFKPDNDVSQYLTYRSFFI